MYHKKSPKQVEKALNTLFKKYKIQNKVDVDTIKMWIWNSKGEGMEPVNKYQKKCFQLFPEPKDIDELNDIMQVFVDAWNHFPHKELGGKAPCDLIEESMKNAPEKNKEERRMPKVRVGNQEMEWEEYEAMLKEMEKAQKPFKKWIENDALPKYKKYLDQLLKHERTRKEYYDVAERFFDRALHVGFTELKLIHPKFVQQDFPRWWPTHIMYSNLTPVQVRKKLEKLFAFIELVYKVRIDQFGFRK